FLSKTELSALSVCEPGENHAVAVKPGSPSQGTGREALLFLDTAVRLIRKGAVRALITAPVSKEMITLSGRKFTGHTEYLSSSFGNRKVIMLFVTGRFTVLLLTRHIPFGKVPSALSSGSLYHDIRTAIGAVSVMRAVSPAKVRTFICGLNPHAGEGGNIGTEEKEILLPLALKLKKGYLVKGPLPADEVYREAGRGRCDLVVSLYHDQALIPLRLLTGRSAVNLTWGLPFIRTSPLHGTAFDIAGKGLADHSGMIAAYRLARKLSEKLNRIK
ncbi:MAG TPA: 4-hydroxythreonine-4-phosphate dehydrogenase PdxA, partial [bacterium]|nr:4-hydroxythreonine-4-phosphate dehydrogenase PdxA [bacterium]